MLKINEVKQLYLGVQGESQEHTITIDVNPWLVEHPNGTVSIWHKRNGDEAPTPTGAVLDRDSGVLSWTLTGMDTYVAGDGMAEIRLTENSVIKKTREVITTVSESVTGAGGVTGSGWQDYINIVEGYKNAAETAQDAAEDARDLAHEWATYGESSEEPSATNNAKYWSEQAEAAQGLAEEAQGKAEAAQGLAEEAQGKAEDAQEAAETAQGLAETAQGNAEDSAEDAEAWAIGKRGGVDVPSTDPTYHNNAKFYDGEANTAAWNANSCVRLAQTAQGKAETAQGLAETAQGLAEDAQGAAEDARDLAHEWATYGESSETPSATNNAKYWAEQAKDSAEDAAQAVQEAIDDTAGDGDTDKLWSANKIYDELELKAPKASPVFTGSISLGRKANTVVGSNSFAVGQYNEASGNSTHVEGSGNKATYLYGHAEGYGTTSSGIASHSEGNGTTASGSATHAEGASTTASGEYSHAEGLGTIASGNSQHVAGKYNVSDSTSIEIIGNGGGTNARKNARQLDANGNEKLKGDIYVGCNDDSTGGTALGAEVEGVKSSIGTVPTGHTVMGDISDVKSAIDGGTFTFTKTYMSDNRYSTNRIYNAEETNIGKKLSDIYSASTTNAFAYMLDVTLSKLVKLPVGTTTTTSNYGCLAFDENDICVWTRRNTAGDVAGNTVDVVLPENAVKMLCVFGNSLNSSGIEYVLTLQRNNALNEIGKTELQVGKIQNLVDFYASEPNTFHVNANATHSSTSNKTFIDIGNGTKFAIVYNRHYANIIQFYGFDSSNNGTLLFSSSQESGYAIITAPTDIKSIGMTVAATANADDYTFVVVTDEQELYHLLYDLSETKEIASNAVASIGDIHRKSFNVNANSTHSSTNDRMSVTIPANTEFIFGFDVTSSNASSLAMIYAIKEDDSSVNFRNIYPNLTVNKLYKITLDYNVKAIGIYYSNTVSTAVTVSTLVAIGQIDTDAIYDNQHDVLFVNELNSNMTRTILAKYADTNDAETFVFFSDPHYLLNNGGMTTERINRLDCEWLRQLKTKADAINAQAVICGGDLINSEQTDSELCYKLGMHHAIARNLFGEKYHLALGNHDTRFDATSQSILDNLLFAEEDTQKAYFTVKTPKTMFYFLNTGTDQNGAMTAYRWTQIAWLAENLQTDTESNRAIAMHIFSNDASGNPENFGNGITPMATNVVSLINAYNSKGTVTLNGTTYNFATATGKIRFILCGHTHYDTVYYATGNIPVVCIDDATAIGTATKLTMYSCLADYENGKLYAYRDGTTTVEVTLA